MQLKYGTNPHQKFATVEPLDPSRSPLELLNGTPSLINFLDALNAWQLVREARLSLGLTAAASFKHVSPAGAAVAVPLDDTLRRVYEVEDKELTPSALAYVRARGADPKSSFGDFVALSDVVDKGTAEFLKGVVSDGIIAPGYEPAALEILKAKKSGGFIVMQADGSFEPPERESREIFGMRLTQDRNAHLVTAKDLEKVVVGSLDADAVRDLLLGLITLKYTQSNSVGYAVGGQMIGIGAGQQSRVDCTKLAGAKAAAWHLQRHPKVLALRFKPSIKRQERINFRVRYIEGDLTKFEREAFAAALDAQVEPLSASERQDFLAKVEGVSLVSDGFIPFRDNIDQASKHGVRFIAQPGGSSRDDEIIAACKDYGMAMAVTNLRLFHH
ncbi:MAG TPA: phosphoribosylaminoimidazolecarboxamide formyltransferase [Polyangiaceae bacterium]|nr:phosphoribosylaminoimidazolecarboxamide formyltransferase [Polyangiaceae bacterium]